MCYKILVGLTHRYLLNNLLIKVLEKKNEYINRLLQNLQSLEAKVSAIKQEETVSFSFFRDAFQKGQEVMGLLHELEMLQIEDMKRHMEKLVLFLSETENRKPVEEQILSEKNEKIIQEEKIVRRIIYAEGIALPTYTNPRTVEPKKEEVIEEIPVLRSVNDIIQASPTKLDVKRSLSLNDRFYYQRELFDNDREAMNSMMLRLNAFDNYENTERYLREKTSWDFKDEKVKSFLELLKKGFE